MNDPSTSPHREGDPRTNMSSASDRIDSKSHLETTKEQGSWRSSLRGLRGVEERGAFTVGLSVGVTDEKGGTRNPTLRSVSFESGGENLKTDVRFTFQVDSTIISIRHRMRTIS